MLSVGLDQVKTKPSTRLTMVQWANRILSKVQKSFWSCTHVNSCQKYALYINLHIY